MSVRFNAPPGWPAPPEAWAPHDDWMPDPDWPTPPRGWTFWTLADEATEPVAATVGDAYGTDRGSWLASLRARASSSATQPAAVADAPAGAPAGTSSEASVAADAPDGEWALDGLLTSVGRVEP